MPGTIIVGLDGSTESRAAAEWAAREAGLRGLAVTLVHVWQPVPEPMALASFLGDETHQHWAERIPREAVEALKTRHPEVEVTVEQRNGAPAEVLLEAAADAELLVLGSRALGGIGGFLVGSVGQSVVARTDRPVVLVRAGGEVSDGRSVVLGLDVAHPDDLVIAFAFEEARRRSAPLTAVHSWNLPSPYVNSLALAGGYDPRDDIADAQAGALAEVLKPWREKYPEVEVAEKSGFGSPAGRLIDESKEAALVVVGRRVRRSPFGVHIGSVAHAVMHHSVAPVAVVAHD
ncbi:Universal stress protein [Streptomyces sp. RB5]|uniref:Universal stress protein n=1 Tax=Streptomyces smaragdinus TaxID=2585196 RepID=A0A7K0CJ96_9ACTN|nr:universal stress protein [Streptomyces smaragdinus]MQY12834.1 Universal stress protein [Streptomyces smaragdinus]